MKGSLGPGELIDVLHQVHDARKTGVLHLMQGEHFRGLRFRMGEIVNGFSSVREEHMGDVLVREGILKASDLERATLVLKSERKRLGQVLIDLGVLDEHGLADALARHGREVLLRAFAEMGGSYNFEDAEQAQASDEETTVRLAPGEMILVARRLDDPDAVRYAIGDLERVLSAAPDPLLRVQRLGLSPGDAYVLSRVDGSARAREIVELVGGDAEEVLKSVLALLCAGLIRKSVPKKPQRRTAPPAPEPPPPPPPAPPPPPPLVAAAPPPAPQPLDPETEALQVEQKVAEAEQLLGDGKFWDSIQLLQKVMPRVPERLGRRARLALARGYRKNPNWVKSAEDLLQNIVQSDPRSVDALIELGNLYEAEGLKSRALAMYRKVVDVESSHGEARAAIKRLSRE